MDEELKARNASMFSIHPWYHVSLSFSNSFFLNSAILAMHTMQILDYCFVSISCEDTKVEVFSGFCKQQ